MTERRLTGRLLVATPALGDPNFRRTVVLVLEHGADGAVGVVLNRPSDTEVVDPLPEWAAVAAEPPVIFVGGPVSQSAVIGLGRASGPLASGGWQPVLERIGVVDLGSGPEAADAIEDLRLFAGYAGWGEAQLEEEVAAGAWFVVDAAPDDALSPRPEQLWRCVLRRQRGELALFADFPDDPSRN